MLGALEVAGIVAQVAQVAHAVVTCPPVPPLSYAPADVGWAAVLVSAVDVAAGVACIGIVGNLLRWTADDHAPLRWLWMAFIMLGFVASAAGLYVSFANRAHAMAVDAWLSQAAHVSPQCVASGSISVNLTANTTALGIQLGGVALALIGLGVVGAIIERRRITPKR
jgi:hypothetical protein